MRVALVDDNKNDLHSFMNIFPNKPLTAVR